MQSTSNAHVVVIGGGPGGSTAATLLVRDGFRVTLLEKAAHPRFHIGESLLPANLTLLDQLGVRDAVEKIGMKKWGVEFNSPSHAQSSGVEFAECYAQRTVSQLDGLEVPFISLGDLKANKKTSGRFSSDRRPTKPNTKPSSGSPKLRRASARCVWPAGAKASWSTPFRT